MQTSTPTAAAGQPAAHPSLRRPQLIAELELARANVAAFDAAVMFGNTHAGTAAAGQPATHPSRSARKCVDCQHAVSAFNVTASDHTLWCNHPAAALDLVSGKCQDRCETMRRLGCGFDGALYEQATPKCPSCNGHRRLRQPYALEVMDCPDCNVSRSSAVSATTASAETGPANNA